MQIRRALGLGVAVALLVSAVPTFAQRNNNNNRNQQQPQQRQADPDTIALVRLVDAVATGQQPAPNDIAVKWDSNHFVKGQAGVTYIPFTLNVDRSQLPAPSVALYIRIVDKNQAAAQAAAAAAPAQPAQGNNNRNNRNQQQAAPTAPTYAWDNIHFIDVPENGKIARAVALQPGQYDVFIALKPRSAAPPAQQQQQQRGGQQAAPAAAAAPEKMTVLRMDLTVPDFNKPELQTSSVILATAVEPVTAQLTPAEQEANPYVFGPMRIVPSPDGRFAKGNELQVIFWIYGATETAGKPDVTVEYNFHIKNPDGTEKYFNKTAPQELNAKTLPAEFSVAAGHQLPGSLVVGLTPFPAGDYRLEIKVTDKPSGKVVTQNVNFTVLPV